MFEAWEGDLHYAAQIRVPARLRTTLELQAKNAAGLKQVLTKRALSGLILRVGKKVQPFVDYEAKLNLSKDQKDPVDLMVYGKVAIPKSSVKIGLSLSRDAEGISIRVLPGKRPPTRWSMGKVQDGTFKRAMKRKEKVYWIHERK